MNKNHESKAQVVAQIKEKLEQSQSAVIIDYRGLTVEEDTELRRQFRQAGVEYKVLKNTMIQRAANELGITGLDDHLNGPTAVAFGISDPVAPAKVITEYINKTKKMSVKCGILDGVAIDPARVQALADLPSKEVLVAKMLGSMQSPISGLVSVLGGTVRSLLYAIKAVMEQQEKSA